MSARALFALFSLTAVSAYSPGETMTDPYTCMNNCINSGGVFCMPFGQSQKGYCCAQANMLPCNVNMMLCTTTGQSTVQQVYPCPFDAGTCGA